MTWRRENGAPTGSDFRTNRVIAIDHNSTYAVVLTQYFR